MVRAEPQLYLYKEEVFKQLKEGHEFLFQFQGYEQCKELAIRVKENPYLSALILQKITAENSKLESGKTLKAEHSNLIVNMSQMLFNNMFLEDRNAFAENTNFIRAFQTYVEDKVSENAFGRD